MSYREKISTVIRAASTSPTLSEIPDDIIQRAREVADILEGFNLFTFNVVATKRHVTGIKFESDYGLQNWLDISIDQSNTAKVCLFDLKTSHYSVSPEDIDYTELPARVQQYKESLA